MSRRDRLLVWYAAVGGAAAWTAHLLLGYGYEEAACNTALSDGSLTPVVIVATVVLGAACAGAIVSGWVQARAVRQERLADPRGRLELMAVGGAIASSIFLLAIVFGGVQVLVLDPCSPS